METLFKDSETFQKERPTKLTDKQSDELFKKLAKEVIENGWSKDDADIIAKDLSDLKYCNSGYERAKELDESWNSIGNYDITTDFVIWLDDLDDEIIRVVDENVKSWVKAHNIKPKYQTGTELSIFVDISRSPELSRGQKIFINGCYAETGQYKVSSQKESKRNYLIDFEKIEDRCEVIK